jgi:hypothetical protein
MIEKPLAEFNMARRQCRGCLKLKRIASKASKVPTVLAMPVIPDINETVQDPSSDLEDSDE